MSLRSEPLEHAVALPDGRALTVRIGVPEDDYVPPREQTLVVVELLEDDRGVAAVDTLLDPDEDAAARELLDEIVAGLESGSLAPTAAAIEPLVDGRR